MVFSDARDKETGGKCRIRQVGRPLDSGSVCGIALVTGVATQLILLLLLLRHRRKIREKSVVMTITMGIAFVVAMTVLVALVAIWIVTIIG